MSPMICPQCGARHAPDGRSCRAMFETVLEREYSLISYGAVHLLTVDAYTLSHARDYGRRSSAFHLISLCRQIERGSSSEIGSAPPRATAREFERLYRSLPMLAPPASSGPVTVADVVDARDGKDHRRRVLAWATSVYGAWSAHHGWARDMAVRFDALATATV